MMRALFGVGTPRGLKHEGQAANGLAALLRLARFVMKALQNAAAAIWATITALRPSRANQIHRAFAA
jgi:hypothetical protein